MGFRLKKLVHARIIPFQVRRSSVVIRSQCAREACRAGDIETVDRVVRRHCQAPGGSTRGRSALRRARARSRSRPVWSAADTGRRRPPPHRPHTRALAIERQPLRSSETLRRRSRPFPWVRHGTTSRAARVGAAHTAIRQDRRRGGRRQRSGDGGELRRALVLDAKDRSDRSPT